MKVQNLSKVLVSLTAMFAASAHACTISSWGDCKIQPGLVLPIYSLERPVVHSNWTDRAIGEALWNNRKPGAVNAAPWLHSDIEGAWKSGYWGKNVQLTVVDTNSSDYRSSARLVGNKAEILTHAGAVTKMAQITAPGVHTVFQSMDNFFGRASVKSFGLTVINASFDTSFLTPFHWTIAGYAHAGNGWGRAVVVKALGNDAKPALSQPFTALNMALKGGSSVIFAGALAQHGNESRGGAVLARYSSFPGTDLDLRKKTLVVGVPDNEMQIAGTSFAAPQISGYAAIVGSKFTSASPTMVTSQLLNTARRDTIKNYDPYYHGRGEASLSRALAPVSIR